MKSKVAFFDQEDEAKKDLGEREREQRGFIETISYLQQNRFLLLLFLFVLLFCFCFSLIPKTGSI